MEAEARDCVLYQRVKTMLITQCLMLLYQMFMARTMLMMMMKKKMIIRRRYHTDFVLVASVVH